MSVQDNHAAATVNPHYVLGLKRQLKEKDDELTQLKARLKKLALDEAQNIAHVT